MQAPRIIKTWGKFRMCQDEFMYFYQRHWTTAECGIDYWERADEKYYAHAIMQDIGRHEDEERCRCDVCLKDMDDER